MSPLEALQADAETTPTGVTVALVTDIGKEDITVPPPGRWKSRANTMLRQGDFDGWAQTVLSDVDAQTWVDLDPTNEEVEAFFAAWKAAAGESVGKSSKSQPGSRPTPRR
jgi:hypothetical protein